MKGCFIIMSSVVFFLIAKMFFIVVIASNSVALPTQKTTKLPKIGPHNIIKPTVAPQDLLSTTYYLRTCPNFEGIIQQKVRDWIKKDYTLAASIIRLHFHDCAVRGCDGSILLNHTGSERSAEPSKTLRGFQVIDEIKAELERKCPKTVSCADILTAAARDATILIGGPFWEVPFGRKDGKISLAKDTNSVPQGHENVTNLIQFFQKLGLNVLDLVALSGAHTIGRCTCNSIRQRVSDPSLNGTIGFDVGLWNLLKKQCRNGINNFVNLDATTPRTFDEVYYTNLESKKGLLSTDQLLNSDGRTAPLVSVLASQPQIFFSQFAASMVNLGNVQVITGTDKNGEIRLNCNFVN